MTGSQPHRTAADFRGRNLSITSCKRDGTPVATPVWFAEQDGSLPVETDAASGKLKRIRRDPAVRIALRSASGRLRGQPVPAVATLLPGLPDPQRRAPVQAEVPIRPDLYHAAAAHPVSAAPGPPTDQVRDRIHHPGAIAGLPATARWTGADSPPSEPPPGLPGTMRMRR